MDASLYYDDRSLVTNQAWSLGNGPNNTSSGGTVDVMKGGSIMLATNATLPMSLTLTADILCSGKNRAKQPNWRRASWEE